MLDFYCPALRLCIELDGSAHDYTYEYDEQRTAYLNAQGIRVVRFTNDQVFTCYDGVVAEIVRICGEMSAQLPSDAPEAQPSAAQLPSQSPPLEGRGASRQASALPSHVGEGSGVGSVTSSLKGE